MTFAATSFLDLVQKTGNAEGVPDLRPAEYPGTINLDSAAEMNTKLREKTFPRIIEALTQPIEKGWNWDGATKAREIVFKGALKEVNDFFFSNRWTDGLPIIPPTPDKVEEFLKYTPFPPDQEVVVLKPSSVRVTPWNIAANGVMAGCRPEHMPVLVAAVEAIGDPMYNLEQLGSTGGWNMFFVVNGPLAKQLGIESGVGLVSRGANMAIGRAMGLIRHNLGGQRPGEVYMGSFGYILPPVFAENEDLLQEMGWNPHHANAGFDRDTSTVSACGTANWGYQMYPTSSEPERIAQVLAYDVARSGSPNHSVGQQQSPRLVFTIFITPGVARVFAENEYSRKDLQEAVWKNARYTLAEVDFESYYGAHEGMRETHRDFLRKGKLPEGVIEKGKMPAWFPRVAQDEDATIPAAPRPEQLPIFVCGDPTRNKSMTFYTMYNTLVTKPIKLPQNWDELIQHLGCTGECRI
ncbi:MAG: hypothetical protein HXY45_02755 [Syntrophaceae bacterium]|nr:hypothetical protein [Syntrophaceae bacterium]